ncbi:hypothetical protein T05_16245 [Trichinella murrelli]|uniref:Uncharacterized protein n=1 Tax=Trichinella murrelli TaxID=144512 RepID=A0A0V0T7C7_9BILA|nr:hypothetical protein T05_16245 [Trichinella murrelli]
MQWKCGDQLTQNAGFRCEDGIPPLGSKRWSDNKAARGNSRPNDWCKHCQWGTQHSVGGGIPLLGSNSWTGKKDDGQVARGKGRPNDRCKHWRWGTQHWVSDGWVVGGDSTLIMRWKCAEQIYNNELLLEWCGSYVPILLNGGKGNQCECMVDWLAVWGKADPTMMKLMKFSEDLNTSELMLEGCKSCYHLWNEWTAGKQKLMGDGRGWAGMNGIMIGVRNDNVVHNSGANPGPVWYGDMLVEGWRSSSSFCIRAGDVVGGGGYTILNEWRSSVEWVYNYVRLWRVAGLFAQLRDILYIRS